MVVGSKLEVFTLVWGWAIADKIFAILATSVLLFPFAYQMFQHLQELEGASNNERGINRSIAKMRNDTLEFFAVLLFCLWPIIPLNVVDIKYGLPCTLAGERTTEYSKTTAQDLQVNEGTQKDINTVKMPILFAAIAGLVELINRQIIDEIPCVTDIVQFDEILRSVGISDESLSREFARFYVECYRPAKERWDKREYNTSVWSGSYFDAAFFASANYTPKIQDVNKLALNSFNQSSPEYVGSRFFIQTPGLYKQCEGDYNSCETGGLAVNKRQGYGQKKIGPSGPSGDGFRSKSVHQNFEPSGLRGEDTTSSLHGRPYCDEWWTGENSRTPGIGLRTQIANHIKEQVKSGNNGPVGSRGKTAISDPDEILKNQGIEAHNSEDFWVRKIFNKKIVTGDLVSENGETLSLNNTLLLAGLADLSLQRLSQFKKLKNINPSSGILSAVKVLTGFYIAMKFARKGAQILQPWSIFLVIIIWFFWFMVRGVTVSSAIEISFMYLSIKSWSWIWAVIWYADQYAYEQATNSNSMLIGSVVSYFDINRLILDVILSIMYIAVPAVMTLILAPKAAALSFGGGGDLSPVNKASNRMAK